MSQLITIEARGDLLCLRATLPPKPGSGKPKPHQQRIALKVHANPTGLSYAEEEAKRVSVLLDRKKFDWQEYLNRSAPTNRSTPTKTVVDWIAELEKDYFNRRARTPKSETTWNTNYVEAFRRLPQDKALTPAILDAAILSTQLGCAKSFAQHLIS